MSVKTNGLSAKTRSVRLVPGTIPPRMNEMTTRETTNPILQDLCNQFLKQTAEFASSFVRAAGISNDQAPSIEGLILTRCGEALTQARLATIELQRG